MVEIECTAPNAATENKSISTDTSCASCGQRLRDSFERLRVDDSRVICGSCYTGLTFPEVTIRCSE
jgi:formylmethanofuran dehydrogenase subunit E